MIIVDKDDIKKYRYAVAKATFLQAYPDYQLEYNYPNTNGMCVRNKENVLESIFMFGEPIVKMSNLISPVKIAYQKQLRLSKHWENTYSAFILNQDFEKLYKKDFVNALVCSAGYYAALPKECKNLFDEIIQDILVVHDLSGHVYKYYGEDSVTNNKYCINDGTISFCSPSVFNDPFDCNCAFADGRDMSKYFRIFCSAPSYDNILMWSYYASNHTGYCFEYSKFNILQAVLKSDVDGLCIIGHVDYKGKRPAMKAPGNSLSFSEMDYYITAAFTKYDLWRHEEEYRIVLLSNKFQGDCDYYQLDASVDAIYGGCKCTCLEIKSDSGAIKVKPLHKDEKEYCLR